MSGFNIVDLENQYDNVILEICKVINNSITNSLEAKTYIGNDLQNNKTRVCLFLKQSIVDNDIENFCFVFLSATMLLKYVYKLSEECNDESEEEKAKRIEKGEKIGEILVNYFSNNR